MELNQSEVYGENSSGSTVDKREVFVWPWKGIVANIPVQLENGKYVAESGARLRDELKRQGFNPLRVQSLWGHAGHAGFAVVEFRNDCAGLADALRFEKVYEGTHQGKSDYFGAQERGNKLYCWVAKQDDYNARNVVGGHLRKKGDLKTIKEYQEDEEKKNRKLVATLVSQAEAQDKRLQDMENKYKETHITLCSLIDEKNEMLRYFNEQRERMQKNTHDHFLRISEESVRAALELEKKQNELNELEKQLVAREVKNLNEIIKLANLKAKQQKNEKAIMEKRRADEKVLKLAEDHKREKETLQRKIVELEKQIDAKQAVELEIQSLKGKLQVTRHMEDGGDELAAKKLDSIQKELEDKEEELEFLNTVNQTLLVTERRSNDELQDARKKLIEIFMGRSSKSIRVRMMGELDSKAFVLGVKRKYPADNFNMKAIELWTQWDSYIRDASWHPFKIVPDGAGKSCKRIVDEEDVKLKSLMNELGQEAYEAVTRALMELTKYNPSGRYIVPELWNQEEQRRASLKEGISCLLTQLAFLKRKKRRTLIGV